MNPYKNIASKHFWKLAVADKNMFEINDLWTPKFKLLPKHKISTFGSCFAQHIGNALNKRAKSWLITETAPNGLSPENQRKYNYNIFTCRTGNIYTTSLLKQWTEWAFDLKPVPKISWENKDRIYDPFRPNIEPHGFQSVDEMYQSRNQTITSFKNSVLQSDFFVFTLGLTESWVNSRFGYEYPMCPGTIAGEFNSNKHKFINQQFNTIINNLKDTIKIMTNKNKMLKFILTVSPVPLTATKSGNHVLNATIESKSILRAVAGQLATNFKNIDYFPSYEIINSPPFKGVFFESNQRSVSKFGVNFVMDTFFNSLVKKFGDEVLLNSGITTQINNISSSDAVCEEELLGAFGGLND